MEIGKMMMGGGEKVITLDDCTTGYDTSTNYGRYYVDFPSGVNWGDIKRFVCIEYYPDGRGCSVHQKNIGTKKLQYLWKSGSAWSDVYTSLQPAESDYRIFLPLGDSLDSETRPAYSLLAILK